MFEYYFFNFFQATHSSKIHDVKWYTKVFLTQKIQINPFLINYYTDRKLNNLRVLCVAII